MALTGEYSEQRVGGIGFRLDISGTDHNGYVIQHAYTTNPDGTGLFFHNGQGDRRQVRGNGQFSARSMRQFKARTRTILLSYTNPENLYEPLDF